DAEQYVYEAGQSFLVDDKLVLDEESYLTILRDGYTHFVGEASLINNVCGLPIVNNPKIWHDDFKLSRGTVAAGFLVRNGIREFAIINGRLLKLS
ncbi:MAG: peptidase M14, partial [Glaciecola sp.]